MGFGAGRGMGGGPRGVRRVRLITSDSGRTGVLSPSSGAVSAPARLED